LLLLAFGALYATSLDAYGMLGWDESEYASLARSVARGQGFTISGKPNSLRPPVLPLAGAASILVCGGASDRVVRSANLVFALLALVVVYGFAVRHYDRATGLMAASALGLSRTFWVSTPQFMAEIPFMAFFSAAVLFFYSGVYEEARYFRWSWLCWGLALLTRYTAMLFAPLGAGIVLVALLTGDEGARARFLSWRFVLAPMAGVLVVTPWFIREQLTFGDALIGVKQSSMQLQVYMPGVSMPWYFYVDSIPRMLLVPLTLMLLVGAGWAVWKRDRLALHCLLVVAGIVSWFSCYRYKEVRMITSTLPFMAVVVAAGTTQLLAPLRRWRAPVLVALMLAVGAVSYVQSRPVLETVVSLGYPSFRQALDFARGHTPPSAVLMGASRPQIYWYTDRQVEDFPDEAAFTSALEHVDWVVVVNFERGQKAYVRDLVKRLTRADEQAGDVYVFRDARFLTVLIRAELLRRRL